MPENPATLNSHLSICVLLVKNGFVKLDAGRKKLKVNVIPLAFLSLVNMQ